MNGRARAPFLFGPRFLFPGLWAPWSRMLVWTPLSPSVDSVADHRELPWCRAAAGQPRGNAELRVVAGAGDAVESVAVGSGADGRSSLDRSGPPGRAAALTEVRHRRARRAGCARLALSPVRDHVLHAVRRRTLATWPGASSLIASKGGRHRLVTGHAASVKSRGHAVVTDCDEIWASSTTDAPGPPRKRFRRGPSLRRKRVRRVELASRLRTTNPVTALGRLTAMRDQGPLISPRMVMTGASRLIHAGSG